MTRVNVKKNWTGNRARTPPCLLVESAAAGWFAPAAASDPELSLLRMRGRGTNSADGREGITAAYGRQGTSSANGRQGISSTNGWERVTSANRREGII